MRPVRERWDVSSNLGQRTGIVSREMAAVDLSESAEKVKNTQLGFILAEVDVGLTFAAIAGNKRKTKEQSRRRARAAYDSGLRFVNRVQLTEEEFELVLGRLRKLREYLQALGETFPS